MVGLIKTKYDIINGKLYQTSGIINLNKIKNWKNFVMGKRNIPNTGRY